MVQMTEFELLQRCGQQDDLAVCFDALREFFSRAGMGDAVRLIDNMEELSSEPGRIAELEQMLESAENECEAKLEEAREAEKEIRDLQARVDKLEGKNECFGLR